MICPACGAPYTEIGVSYETYLATTYDPEREAWSGVPTVRIKRLTEVWFTCCGTEVFTDDPLYAMIAHASMEDVLGDPEWWDERGGRDDYIDV